MSQDETDAKLESKLAQISASVYESSPELRDLIDKVSSGEIDEHEALTQMMQVVTSTESLNTSLQAFANETMGELKATNPAIFQPPSGLPRLDPMFEARLFERIQFDEDAPELRRGPLPPNVKPAVPVENAAPNPVALGAALKTASEEMEAEIKALINAQENSDSTEITPWAHSGFANLPQPANYQPGTLPALINVASPDGGTLAAFTLPESQELAWKAAITTHGRRSAAATIQKIVVGHLKELGFDVEPRPLNASTEGVLKKTIWTFSILGTGAESTQSAFSPVSNASAAIANDLSQHFRNANGMMDISTPMWFEITTVDMIEERTVGWAALLREKS